jgi:hypothetical protein
LHEIISRFLPFKEKTSYTVMSNCRQEYNQKHRELVISKVLARYHENIEEIREKQKEPTACACGAVLRKDGMAKHRKTKQHLQLIEQN